MAPESPEPLTKQEQIRRRAYEIYRQRELIGVPGDALSDWLEAEADVEAGRTEFGVT